jgi:hypothetical protein
VGEAKAKESRFIRALMTEVCASAIEGKYKSILWG